MVSGLETDCKRRMSAGEETMSGYSIASELGCDIGIDIVLGFEEDSFLLWCESHSACRDRCCGYILFSSKEFMTMSASWFLPAHDAN